MSDNKNFIHLHVHSHFSLLDGCIHHKNLVNKAVEMGMPALALTDHGSLFGTIEFYQAAKAKNLKPIIGMEAYVAEGSRLEKTVEDRPAKIYHLSLLARNDQGYKNLIQLSSQAYVDGFYRKPRVDHELLEKYGEGLTVLSGCMGGAIPQLVQSGNLEAAEKMACRYKEIFGSDHFFLELMRNGVEGQEQVNEALIAMARKNAIPLIATNDVHYLEREDSLVHEVMLCINTGQTLNDQNRMKLETDQFYFRSGEEMHDLFHDLPEAVDNTMRVADQCNLELNFNEYHLPEFHTDTEEEPEAYLRRLCLEGVAKRYPEITPKIQERIDMELEVINSMGFPSYFLITWDFIKYARDHQIPVGPGRGSAAGSIVAYSLGITDVDPLRYDLIFERFLNSSRISMPDIDIDFCRDGREKVIQYVQEKYGAANVCQIVTFGTMAAKAAVRDAGRVLGIDLQTVDRIAKKIPMAVGTKLKEALESDPEMKALYNDDQEARELFDISLKIEGLNRHASTHAAGVVITDKPLMEYVPLCRVQNEINTQYQMTALEMIGLLKMDFLGLKNLTILDKAVHLIKETTGDEVDLAAIPLDDPAAFALLQSGMTLGIFQLESDGMSNLLVKLRPDSFEDIIALLALYRPGPLNSGMADTYVRRKHKLEEVDYLHDSLKEVLEETYGVIVYQEQVMRIANILAGFSMNDADSLRKAMGKKKIEVMAKFRDMFIDGAVAKGVDRASATDIYDKIEYFAGYGFNKSHSTAYGVVTYQTAYLKANYPLQYMSALMSCDAGNSDKIADYRDECQRMGIKVLGPDYNESALDFAVAGEAIRFGLSAIKGLGEKAVETITETRTRVGAYTSLQHMLTEVDLKAINKGAVEALIKSGTFDSAGVTRASLCTHLEGAMKWAAGVQADRVSGQKGLFGSAGMDLETVQLPPMEEWEEEEKLDHEREVLGFVISVDLLQKNARILDFLAPISMEEACNLPEGANLTVGGLVTAMRIHMPKSGRNAKKKMALFKIRMKGGSLSSVAFAKEYEEFIDYIQDDRFCIFSGSMGRGRDGTMPSLRIAAVASLDDYLESRCHTLIARFESEDQVNETVLKEIKAAAAEAPGSCDLLCYFPSRGGQPYTVKAGDQYRLKLSQETIERFEKIVGRGNVEIR